MLRRIHDLVALHALLPTDDQARFDEADLDALNPWTIEGRYPADMADAATERVKDLLQAARRILTAARSALDDD